MDKEQILALAGECGILKRLSPLGTDEVWGCVGNVEDFYHAARKPLEEEVERIGNEYEALNKATGVVICDLRQQLADAERSYALLASDRQTVAHHLTTIESLRQQLSDKDAEIAKVTEQKNCMWFEIAAAQLQIKQYREALESCDEACVDSINSGEQYYDEVLVDRALALPEDTTALQAVIQKAGEVMRSKAVAETERTFDTNGRLVYFKDFSDAIRAIPGVTLEDLR